jgi:ribosomal protein L11 methyltransferase
VEIDAAALAVAAENARLNGLESRLQLVRGDARAVAGAWPFIVANIRAAELIEMAPTLVRRAASRGRLVLSGIPGGVAPDVQRAYERLGLRCVQTRERGGWVALELVASW